MEKENLNFSFSELEVTSRPRQFSVGSYGNNYNQKDSSSVENLKQLASRRNTSEPQLSNINNIPITLNVPIVYPAILSQVATVFMRYVPVASYIKDSIKYTNCFRGSDAVEILKLIIRTSDRNLALLLGRALGSQNFFHDVTYNHFLRDNPNELYQFSTAITNLSIPAAVNESLCNINEENKSEDDDSLQEKKEQVIESAKKSEINALPNGVYTLLTRCYSPTCSEGNMCYSISCPRRLEQQNLLNHVARTTALAEKIMNKVDSGNSENQYWSTVMPESIVKSVSETERKRQEVIFELIKTEREYVEDLDLIQKLYIQKLRFSNIIEEEKRESFIGKAFINIPQLYLINHRFYQLLCARQKQEPVVSRVGDIFLACINDFEHYIEYGFKQIFGKYIVETENLKNPTFKDFLKQCERHPKCRKLPIQSFLARPTTRIGRYPLLIEAILKRTPETNPDYKDLKEVIVLLKNILQQINEKAGKAQNNLKLSLLNYQLVFNSGEWYDLKLTAPERKLIREGTFNIKIQGYETELTVFLFDHLLVLAKRKKNGLYKVFRTPIPLETLIINDKSLHQRRASSIFNAKSNSDRNSISSVKSNSSSNLTSLQYQDINKYPLVLVQLGRNGGMYVLYAMSFADRRAWKDAIEKQRAVVQEKMKIYEIVSIGTSSCFTVSNRVNCVLPFNENLVVGSENGLYIGPADGSGSFERIINLPKINQIDILPDLEFFVILSDKSVYVYSCNVLKRDSSSSVENEKKLCSNVTFFKVGLCLGRYLIACVKSSTSTSTIRTFEYTHSQSTKNRRLMKLLKNNNSKDRVKSFKEFYIHDECNSVYYLRSKICIAGSKAFQVIDMETLLTQDLIDFSDPSFEFMKRKDLVIKPLSIFRIANDIYILCFSNFALFIDRLGRRARPNKMIYWLGVPTVFAIHYQYIFAFDSEFVEIRSLESCEIVQIIHCHKLKNLNRNTLHCVMEGQTPYQIIFRLICPTVPVTEIEREAELQVLVLASKMKSKKQIIIILIT
ncbi:hypothetical protein PIROE2DRAFT_65929 [Piromyces sp. E2]|nr:hypothetical protein PIROE2DRAFT_65929 [Piromyces sp. E2]|eukprot:OUM68300.1 hypothetical protein PIROE2DRAFT_65929 [Piromyces sp. E2]